MKLNITVENKTYEVDVEIQEDENARGGYIPPHSAGTPVVMAPVPIAAPTSGAGRGPASDADPAKVCHSPIAGIVIKVLAQVGQQLQADDLLLVLEAMKMETNVTAPRAGKVKDIFVRPGDGVQVNQVLVEFE